MGYGLGVIRDFRLSLEEEQGAQHALEVRQLSRVVGMSGECPWEASVGDLHPLLRESVLRISKEAGA